MNATLCSVSLSFNSELRTDNSALHLSGGESGHSKSRAPKLLALLQGGQPPRRLPTRGTHPPRSPCSNPTLGASMLSHILAPYVSRLTFHVFSWRRGWDSNPRSHCWDACFPSMSIRPLSHLSAPILRGGILTRGLVTGKVSAIVAE